MFLMVTLRTALCLLRSQELTLHCRIVLSHSEYAVLLGMDTGIFCRETSEGLAYAFLTGTLSSMKSVIIP